MSPETPRMHGHRPPAPGRNSQHDSRAQTAGALHQPGKFHRESLRRGPSCGKDTWWKSPKADFPTTLGNPANKAGFPLSHSYDDGGYMNTKPDISCATKSGHFHLLTTACKIALDRIRQWA